MKSSILIAGAAFLGGVLLTTTGAHAQSADAVVIAPHGMADGRVTFTDDPLEPIATMSTLKRDTRMRKLDDRSWGDSYLRASIDRKTGALEISAVQRLRFWGPQRSYDAAHYRHGDELRRTATKVNHVGPATCANNPFNADCILHQEVSFAIEEATLRAIAAQSNTGWPFRMKEYGGNDLTSSIGAAEAASLLAAIDRYRNRAAPAAS